MPILAFQKPDKVVMLESSNSFGKFEFRPLEPGYGQTIGNALRRILLSSLGGFAICSIRIEGAMGERIVVNDRKPSGLDMAVAMNIDRDCFALPQIIREK